MSDVGRNRGRELRKESLIFMVCWFAFMVGLVNWLDKYSLFVGLHPPTSLRTGPGKGMTGLIADGVD